MDTSELEDAISSLTDKLNGIGIEIYHLKSTISSLNESVKRLATIHEDKNEY